jgi:hypothetical protein
MVNEVLMTPALKIPSRLLEGIALTAIFSREARPSPAP